MSDEQHYIKIHKVSFSETEKTNKSGVKVIFILHSLLLHCAGDIYSSKHLFIQKHSLPFPMHLKLKMIIKCITIDKLGRSHLMAPPVNGLKLEINLAQA